MAAGQTLGQVEPTLPTNVAQTATAVAQTATAISGTQAALSGQQSQLTSTAAALTATATAASAAAAAANATPTGTPAGVVSNIPVVNVGCLGDEQLWFVPRKPNVGVHVQISVTSQRHHDVRAMALGGPIDPGPVTERVGPLGFIWTWTISPSVEAFYEWTFYADGLRPCITSGFNAYAPVGATQTPTETPIPTSTPGTLTATPTGTPVPIPSISTASTTGTCGSVITVTGNNFGSPPSSFGTSIQLLGGPPASGTPILLSLIGGSNTQVTATLPSSGLVAGSNFNLVVVNNGGASNTVPFRVTECGSAAQTPTATMLPAPVVNSVSQRTGGCGTSFAISGSNFGTSVGAVRAQLINGTPSGGPVDLNVVNVTNTVISVNVPKTGVPQATYLVFVTSDGGPSNQSVTFEVNPGCVGTPTA